MTYGMSIVEQDELIKTLSNEQLQNYANNPDGTLPLYLVVAQLKRNEDTRGRFSALQAERQTAQQPRTVVERLAPPRHGEIPVPSSQVAANPAPQTLPQQGPSPAPMPTINAQGGMDFEKMVEAFAKVAAAEKKEEEAVDMRKPDHFGSERRGSFEKGGETPTSQYPATTFAALRKALVNKEMGGVHRGRRTRAPYQPEGKKGRFTAAARHGQELTDRDFYTWNPMEMAMTQGGLAGLSKRGRGRTVNAAFGFPGDMKAEEDRWLRAGRKDRGSGDPILSQYFYGLAGDPSEEERVRLSNLETAKRNIQTYAPRKDPDELRAAEVKYDEALQAFVPADEAGQDTAPSIPFSNIALDTRADIALDTSADPSQRYMEGFPITESGDFDIDNFTEDQLTRFAYNPPDKMGGPRPVPTTLMGPDQYAAETYMIDENRRELIPDPDLEGHPALARKRAAFLDANIEAARKERDEYRRAFPNAPERMMRRFNKAVDDALMLRDREFSGAEEVDVDWLNREFLGLRPANLGEEVGREAPAPVVGGLHSSAARALLANPNLALGETAAGQNVIKILLATPEGQQLLVDARATIDAAQTDGIVAATKPQPPLTAPEEAGVELTDAAYAEALQEFAVAGTAEAERARLAKEATLAEEKLYAEQGVKGEGRLDLLKKNANKKLAMEGKPPADLSQLEQNIRKLHAELLLEQGKLPTVQTADERMASYKKWVQPSRDAQYKVMREAIETQGKASQAHIGSVEKAGEAVKEFSRTGKLPKGRRDALLNKLLLTWGSALLGNPTLADAMSQGFAASIDVIEGEQKNYAKALTDELQAVKAVGELKMKAADSRAAALRNIASARAADAKQNEQMSVKFMEMANKDIETLMTHKRGMLTLSYQALTARVALLNARKPTAATNQMLAVTQDIRTKFGAYITDYDKALKKAKEDKTSPEAATDIVNKKYGTHFGMNKYGVLDVDEWKPNAFKAAAGMMQRSTTSPWTPAARISLRNTAIDAHGKLTEGSLPKVLEDNTSMVVLKYLLPSLTSDGKNLLDLYGKNKALVTDHFVELYEAERTAEINGQPSPIASLGKMKGKTTMRKVN